MFRIIAASLLLLGAIVGSTLLFGADMVSALNPQRDLCEGSGGVWNGSGCNTPGDKTVTGLFGSITNILIFLTGAISVIMIVVGGFKYVVSAGDQTAAASAKNTILYAVIGLVVAFAAYAVVNFVLVEFIGAPESGPRERV